jgi:hypothetical protein
MRGENGGRVGWGGQGEIKADEAFDRAYKVGTSPAAHTSLAASTSP